MSKVRFLTAQDLFDAFPSARSDVAAQPNDSPSMAFLRALIDRKAYEDGVGFAAYLLPRREAVWWACRSIRSFAPTKDVEDDSLRVAEAWVKEPEEERRQAAMSYGMAADRRLATTWCALAAAWSGGSLTLPDQVPVPCPPYLTAQASRNAVLIGVARHATAERGQRLAGCLEMALRFANAEG